MSARTFKVRQPPMRGDDVKAWQRFINRQLIYWRVDYALRVDGVYLQVTRDAGASLLHGLGFASASAAMADGLTPELRTKVRHKRLDEDELQRFRERAPWRAAFRRRHADPDVAPPLARILASSWGYTPPVHDGADLICRPRAAGLAICKARVIRADNGGWWRKGAPSADVAAKGDGIVIIESLIDAGPFRRGLRFGYGHAEHVRVKPGDLVEAGQVICEAGLAVAWHFHFMCNDGVGEGDRGIGDRDPMPFVRYAQRAAAA